MHRVVLDEPYEFVPPHTGTLWPRFLQMFLPGRLRKDFGIQETNCIGLEKIAASMAAGHSIVLAPNHCRPSDPLIVNELCRQAGLQSHTMASWHVFKSTWLKRFILRRVGGFSVYREGADRQSLNAAIDILVDGKRPLVVFPEGVITRTNDRVYAMMEGLSFIARSAAKKRIKNNSDAKVVVHPIAIRYTFQGDVNKTLHQALDDIEERLSWRPKQDDASLQDRIIRVGNALLWLKEIEYFGEPRSGTIATRLRDLIDRMLVPMEKEWLNGAADKDKTVVARVKALRSAVLPDMIEGDLSETETSRRWEQLADMYLAQQLGHYPPDYIASNPTPERMLETVEKLEEDLTDHCRVHGPMIATVQVGDAIEVSPKRVRGGEDPVMSRLETDMHSLLGLPQPAAVSQNEASLG